MLASSMQGEAPHANLRVWCCVIIGEGSHGPILVQSGVETFSQGCQSIHAQDLSSPQGEQY